MNRTTYKETAEIPVENAEQDRLGLDAYSASLAIYIKNCVTPTTIAVQGDWGSGKTSLLHMIRSTLNPSAPAENTNNAEYLCIDFNTWQYSQFEMSDSLSITFLTCFLNALQDKLGKTQKLSGTLDTIKKVTAGFAKRAALYTVGKFGGDELKDAAEEAIDTINGEPSTSEIDLIKQLKSQISECIDEVIISGKKRIVVFIDDLDRLNPVKAVELLEIIKIFLDCPHCVYVLAVDTDVIKQGIVQKYGLSEEKSHAFFEKLIQLPFIMPISYYHFDKYTKSIFPTDGDLNYQADFFDKLTPEDQKRCTTLLSLASNKNPRATKRIINSFVLLDMVNRKNRPIPNTEDKAEKYRAVAKVLLALTCIQVKLEPDYRTIIDMAAFRNRFSKWIENNDLLILDEVELQRKYNYSGEQADNYIRTKNACCSMITIFKEWCLDFNSLFGNDGIALQILLQSTNKTEQKNTGNYSLLARNILNEFENTLRDIRRKVILNCLENQKMNPDYSLWYDEAVKLLTSRPEKTTHLSSQEMLDKITLLIQSVDLARVDEDKVTQILDLYESLDSVKFHYTYTNMIEESFLLAAGERLSSMFKTYKRAEENITPYLQVQDIFSLPSEYNIGYDPNRLTAAKCGLSLLDNHLCLLLDANEELNDVYTQLKERIIYFYTGMRAFAVNQRKGYFATSAPIPSLFTFALMSEAEDAKAFSEMEKVLLGKGVPDYYYNKTPSYAGDFTPKQKDDIQAYNYNKVNLIQIDVKQCLRIYEKVMPLLSLQDEVFNTAFGWIGTQSSNLKELERTLDNSKPDSETVANYEKQRMILLFGITSALAYLDSKEQYSADVNVFRKEAGSDFNCIFRAVDIIKQEYFSTADDNHLKNPAVLLGVCREAMDELQLALDNTDGWQYEDLPAGYLDLTLGMVREFCNQPSKNLADNRASYELGMLIARHFDENKPCYPRFVYEEKSENGMVNGWQDYCCFEKRENTFLWKYYEVFTKVINCLRVQNSDFQKLVFKQDGYRKYAGILGAETDLSVNGIEEAQDQIRSTVNDMLCLRDQKPDTSLHCNMDLAKQIKAILEDIHNDVLNKLFEVGCINSVSYHTGSYVLDYFKAMGGLIYREIPQFMHFVETGNLSTDNEVDAEVFEHMNPHHRKFWKKYNDILQLLRELL